MTKFFLSALALICLFNANAYSQKKKKNYKTACSDAATQVKVNDCSKREYEKADAGMNKVYQQLLSALAEGEGGNEDQQKLKDAQSFWLKYRDANCISEASIYEGGTIHAAIYNFCLASVTEERTKRLKKFLAETQK